MKNKGFTLVELISILTILAIIALITIPVMTKTIKNAEQKSLNEQKQVIINAAKKYALDISDELPEYDGDVYIITVNKLRNSAYLNEDNIVDPTTNKAMNGCVRVTYVGSKGNYKYELRTEPETVTLRKGQACEFEVYLKPLCSCKLQLSDNSVYAGCLGAKHYFETYYNR